MNKLFKIASVAGAIGMGSLLAAIPAHAHSDGHSNNHEYKNDNAHKYGDNNRGWRYGNRHDSWPKKHRKLRRHKHRFTHGHYNHRDRHHSNHHAGNRHRDCHRVYKYKRDYYGDKVRVIGKKCYDRHGYGYIVPGSRRVQHVY